MNTHLPTIIYGPQGCGKTTHAKALAALYGKETIIDHDGRSDLHSYGGTALVLTQTPLPGAIAFADAMAAVQASGSNNPDNTLSRAA